MSTFRPLIIASRIVHQATLRHQINPARNLHSTRLLSVDKHVQPTPDLYLKDGATGAVSSGATESEGSEDQERPQKYVVAGVLPSESHYGVPAGAFHSGDPLEPQEEAAAPVKGQHSSTSADYAHPGTTTKASRVEDGVGSSASLRHRDAKGQMSKGSYGGEELTKGTHASENTLADRNPQPDAEGGKQGIKEAWKHRK
ncbi:hypothetical protein FRB94_014052 [Tulasnella sp. JGI-2019a]|nr:hypothetical protein FRB93_013964 [Tulasnella sp. JGI-2019a]KAG9007724.1 hypothetical protein FRB94_014052 [Tulasnella sp. JGI-2019a]KAG9034930.1 hypothetical protein FRB95_012346 [Tulasnella sp. JGI-2019a]